MGYILSRLADLYRFNFAKYSPSCSSSPGLQWSCALLHVRSVLLVLILWDGWRGGRDPGHLHYLLRKLELSRNGPFKAIPCNEQGRPELHQPLRAPFGVRRVCLERAALGWAVPSGAGSSERIHRCCCWGLAARRLLHGERNEETRLRHGAPAVAVPCPPSRDPRCREMAPAFRGCGDVARRGRGHRLGTKAELLWGWSLPLGPGRTGAKRCRERGCRDFWSRGEPSWSCVGSSRGGPPAGARRRGLRLWGLSFCQD